MGFAKKNKVFNIPDGLIYLESNEQLKVYLEEKTNQTMDEIVEFIYSKATENIVKNNSIDTGNLMNDVTLDKTLDDKKVVIWNVPYAEYVEYGSLPHWLPKEVIENDLAKWAHRKLRVPDEDSINVARRIAYKIAKEGIEPKPFVRPAIDEAVLYFGNRQTAKF